MFKRALLAVLALLAVAAGCSEAALQARDEPGDAGPPAPVLDSSVPAPAEGGALEGGAPEASALDAPGDVPRDVPPDVPLVPSAALRQFPRQGNPVDDATPPVGPGLLLDGGFGGRVTRIWMHDTSTGGAPSHGDVVVLTAAMNDASGGWLAAAPFASVQTVALVDGATDADLRIAAALVSRAEVVWFTGGDQASYVRWKGTPLMTAVQGVFDRGGVVGGSSAGMIILGSSVNDAFNSPSQNILTPLALADPYDPRIHFTQDVLRFPFLRRSITDPHFSARDRMGRLSTFMARQVKDGFASPDILGIGVDDGAALAIGSDGHARRLAAVDGPGIFVVRGGAPNRAVAGEPLVYRGLRILKLADAGHDYDFVRRCGLGLVRTFDVDGTQTPPYDAEVYSDGELTGDCP